jgi:hypothetical protein
MLVLEREQLETMERQMFESLHRRLQGAIAATALEVKDSSAVSRRGIDMAVFVALGLARCMLPRETRTDLITQSFECPDPDGARIAVIEAHLAAVNGNPALSLVTRRVT